MTGKIYCILGGGGAFAIHCAMYLLDHANPKQVVGIGRAPLRPEPFTLNIANCERYTYRQFHVGYEQDLLLEYLEVLNPDVIINFAAQGEGVASWRHSWRFFDTNATALVRLYEALGHRVWSGHFIQIGTSELYGSVTAPASEEAPIVPTSPYAASKAAFDMYLLAMKQQGYGPLATILRPSNCYCQGQLLHRIVPRAIVSGLLGRKMPLHGGGVAQKSYMHARDLAQAIYLVSQAGSLAPVYNVGPDQPTAIRDVAERCAMAIGLRLEDLFEVAPERVGQDSCYWLDSSKIKALGWNQTIDWSTGLAEVALWADEYLGQLQHWPTDYQLRA